MTCLGCFRERRTRQWQWNKFERGRRYRNVNYSAFHIRDASLSFAFELLTIIVKIVLSITAPPAAAKLLTKQDVAFLTKTLEWFSCTLPIILDKVVTWLLKMSDTATLTPSTVFLSLFNNNWSTVKAVKIFWTLKRKKSRIYKT